MQSIPPPPFQPLLSYKGIEIVLSCLVSLECTLGGLFLAHAAAGLHCTVQSITPPWVCETIPTASCLQPTATLIRYPGTQKSKLKHKEKTERTRAAARKLIMPIKAENHVQFIPATQHIYCLVYSHWLLTAPHTSPNPQTGAVLDLGPVASFVL